MYPVRELDTTERSCFNRTDERETPREGVENRSIRESSGAQSCFWEFLGFSSDVCNPDRHR